MRPLKKAGPLDVPPAARPTPEVESPAVQPMTFLSATQLATADAQSTLTLLDWTMIGAYFGILLAVAWWVVRKGKETADDYFLAGRNLGWWIVGASIFASNIGSEHIVGLAGSGAADGVALAHYELHAWCLLVLGWVFVPFYMRSLGSSRCRSSSNGGSRARRATC